MSLHNLHEDGTDLDNYEVSHGSELIVDHVAMKFVIGCCDIGGVKTLQGPCYDACKQRVKYRYFLHHKISSV